MLRAVAAGYTAIVTVVDRTVDGLLGAGVGSSESELWDRVLRGGRRSTTRLTVPGRVADSVLLVKDIFQRHGGGVTAGFCGDVSERWWARFFDRGETCRRKCVRGIRSLNRTTAADSSYTIRGDGILIQEQT